MSASSKAGCVLLGALAAWLTTGVVRYLWQRAVVIRLAEAITRQEAKDARGT
jgi:hypothetical protein